MGRKVIAIWLSLIMMVSVVVIVDVSMDISLNVGGTTLYVNTTGSGGAYTRIQDAINDSKDGDTVFVYNGTYYENVVVNKTINLTGEDRNNTIVDGGSSGIVIRITSYSIEITGFTLLGNGSNLSDAGIELYYVSECNVSGNKIFTEDGYSIHLYYSDDNTIAYNNVSANFDGIHLRNSNNNKIINNIALKSGDSISLSRSNSNLISGNNGSSGNKAVALWYSNGNDVVNNDAYNTKWGISLEYTYSNRISNNRLTEGHLYILGDTLSYWNTHEIDSLNTFNGKPIFYRKNQTGGIIPPNAGEIILANCTNVKIENQIMTNGSYGIILGFSSSNNISNNHMSSNYANSIRLYKSNDNYIINNSLSLNFYNGVFLHNSDGNKIISNNFYLNNYQGLQLSSSNHNTIINNTFYTHNQQGIRISSSNNNTIMENYISSSNQNGIYLFQSDNNSIFNNSILSNKNYGIYLESSPSNLIYHNNFIENINQAYDDSIDGNQWDNGYPSGGNFWSDYNGIDEFRGPNQNISGSDGIGDINYSIDSDSVDNYPLMNPIENITYLYEGWNLISIPTTLSDTRIDNVLDSIEGLYNAIQWFDNTDLSDHWKHNHTSKSNLKNDLNNIDHAMGFWVHIIEKGGALFKYSGVKPIQNQTFTLHPGWNMVGYPSKTNYNRTEGLNNLTFGQEIDLIQWFDAATKTWNNLDENDYFEQGRGYWIHSKVECEWEVPL